MKSIAGLGLFGLAAFLVYAFMVKAKRPLGPEPPPSSTRSVAALPADLRRRLAGAADLVAPTMFREALARYAGTPGEREVRELLATRATEIYERGLAARTEAYLDAYRYRTAAELVERYLAAWKGLPVAGRMQELLDGIRAEQEGQIRSREEEAEALLAAGRFDAAREALPSGMELEAPYQARLDEIRTVLARRIRVAQHESTPPPPSGGRPPGRPEAARATLAAPPPLPGIPHPDVKRLAEAREMMAQARRLFGQRRYEPAAKALGDVVGYYGDLPYVQRRQDAVGAMGALARHAAKGVPGLFHATKAELRGRTLRLRYTFKAADEYLDWEELATIPHKDPGEFTSGRDGVRGSGVMSYLHRGVFENDVEISCEVAPNKLQTHGLMFAQSELETRQLMWVVTNHWLVEGENYVKERPGHSILMFGKGVNNDVPVDSPEIGFIFRGGTLTGPNPGPNEAFRISFALRQDKMEGQIVCRDGKGSRSGSARGDDGRGVERVRPGLIVIQNTVVFRDVVIEGRLHPSFEKRRVAELLDLASALD